MIENLQNNDELVNDIEGEIGSEQNFVEDNSNKISTETLETAGKKSQETEQKQNNSPKPKAAVKQPEKTMTMPTAKKTLALPMIYEFAVKELKARRNFAKQLRGEKGMETEEDIFVEIFRLFFSQPGESADCLRVAQERMDLLIKESKY